MRGFNDLKLKVEELVKKFSELNEESEKYKEENERLKKNLDYFENQAGEVPGIAQKNRKLLNERQKIAEKINGVIKKLEEVK